jgi:predicted transcriptional regulator
VGSRRTATQTHKHTAHLDTGIARDLAALAAGRRVPATRIVRAAVASFLSPDSDAQTEAAITRRLDSLTRAMERPERAREIAGEDLAPFIRFRLTTTPPVSDDLRAAAQAKGRERYGRFVESLAKETTVCREPMRDLAAARSAPQDGEGSERWGRQRASARQGLVHARPRQEGER